MLSNVKVYFKLVIKYFPEETEIAHIHNFLFMANNFMRKKKHFVSQIVQ